MTTFRGFDPATMHARPMAAYRASTCLCGQPIAVGDGIAMLKRRWRCMTCNTKPDNTPTPESEESA